MPSPGGILRELHIPWPAANEGDLREASAAWANLAAVIRDNHGMANKAATSITSNNHGQAIDAFEQYWGKSYGGKGSLLPRGAEACTAMSKATARYADAVSDAKSKIEQAGIEVAATLVVGTVGAIFTFGMAEGATVEAAAAWLTQAVQTILVAFGDATAEIVAEAFYSMASAMATDTALDITASGLVGGAVGLSGTTLADTARETLRQIFGQEPLRAC